MTQKLTHAVRHRFGNKMSPFDLNCYLNRRCYVSKMHHFLINKTFTLFVFADYFGCFVFKFSF